MEDLKNRYPHAFIQILAQDLLRKIEENDFIQSKNIANEIQTLNYVATDSNKKLENEIVDLKKKLDDSKGLLLKRDGTR